MSSSVAELYRRLRAVIRRVPRGRVATYGQIAELAGIPGGARVAAASLKTSTPADRLPWQRIVGKVGPRRARIAIHDPVGAALQRQRLEAEGVALDDAGRIDLDRYGWLPTATAGSRRAGSPRRRPRSGSTHRA
jgi:methylated-DNA-protein-cysteine methyltransferase-like protein